MLAKRSISILLICVATAAIAAPHHPNKKFWAKQYAAINHMFETKDTAAFEALLSPDYYEIDESGKKLDRDTFLRTEVEPMKQADKVKSNVKVTKITEKGDDAEIAYDWKFSMIVGPDKTSGREVGVDGWHKTDGKWMNVWTKVKTATSKTVKMKEHKKK